MPELHPMFSYGADAMITCPKCQTPGGYVTRLPRPWWRRLLFLRKPYYLCQECEHRFYDTEERDRYD